MTTLIPTLMTVNPPTTMTVPTLTIRKRTVITKPTLITHTYPQTTPNPNQAKVQEYFASR
jgi:hypothetical protein